MITVLGLFLATLAPSAQAATGPQQPSAWTAGLPAPSAFSGRAAGPAILSPHEVAAYSKALATASPRVLYRAHGRSVEGRELFHLLISDPARLAALPLENPGDTVAAEASPPAVIWLGGAVHGDEHSSTEALLQAAWHLAAEERWEKLLTQVVVILEPLQNPDGRQRFCSHAESARFGDANADPQAWEHQQDWPGGRGNHFFVDLNRDWFLGTQPETRARRKVYMEWLPHVFIDLHEMSGDSTYFFAPPAEPVLDMVPATTRAWWKSFGDVLGANFDRRGEPYYRRERFDIFYPGYGDSWPSLQGAVGMTFEQASVRGIVRRRSDGVERTLAQAIANHLAAALAAVEHSATESRRLVAEGKAARLGEGGFTAFIAADNSEESLLHLDEMLAAQGIPVQRLARAAKVRGLGDYRGGENLTLTLKAGTRVIRTSGAGGRLAAALLEPDKLLPADYLAEERRLLLAGRPGRIFDVTAWSLPLVYDLKAWWTKSSPRLSLDNIPPAAPVAPPPRAGAAYLLPPAGLSWARTVGRLLDQGIAVKVTGRAMTRAGASLLPGTAIVPVHQQPVQVHEAVRATAVDHRSRWLAVDSFSSDEGIDLGSGHVKPVRPGAVAVLAGEPVSATSFGAVAGLLSGDGGRPFTALPLARLARSDLSRYGTVVLPDGSAAGYRRALSGAGVKALRRFAEAGGILITIGGAAAFCGHEEVALCRTRALTALPPGSESPDPAPPEQALWRVPGAILQVEMDPEDSLSFGRRKSMPVPVNGDLVLKAPQRQDVRVVGRFSAEESLRLSGLMWPEAAGRLAGTPWLVRETLGRGAVILFAHDPNFRGAWDSLRAVFMNAILLERNP